MFRGDAAFGTWITRIAMNESLGRLRKRRPTVDWETYGENRTQAQLIDFPVSAASNDPEKMMAQGEIRVVLEKAIDEIQAGMDGGFNKQLQDLLPAFTLFGYPGLSDPRLLTETTLDVERLLKDHTRVHYAGVNGINLPEAYNGLGVRNLVFILFKLYEFFKSFKSLCPEYRIAHRRNLRPPMGQRRFGKEHSERLCPQNSKIADRAN